LTDPNPDITYHETTRRGSRILPLRSYGNPSAESKFDGLDYFDFKLKNVSESLSQLMFILTFISVCRSINGYNLSLQSLQNSIEYHYTKTCYRCLYLTLRLHNVFI